MTGLRAKFWQKKGKTFISRKLVPWVANIWLNHAVLDLSLTKPFLSAVCHAILTEGGLRDRLRDEVTNV